MASVLDFGWWEVSASAIQLRPRPKQATPGSSSKTTGKIDSTKLIFFDLFSTPLGRSVRDLAPHCNKCQFSTRFQRADDRSTPPENSGPGARASDPVLVFELQDLRRSYWQCSKYVLSRCAQHEANRTGSAMLRRPIEREHKHDGMETRNTAAVLRDSQLLPTDAAEAFWRLV